MKTHNSVRFESGYVETHGLRLYYESHGSGDPLLLLPGSLSGIQTAFGKVIPLLSQKRRVIAIDPPGYGRTADIDRPLSYEQNAQYVVGLLQVLNIQHADILGYSTGAATALLIGLQRPELVHKLILCSLTYKSSGFYPEVLAGSDALSAELLAGSPYEKEYLSTAPSPDKWPHLIEKVKKFNQQEQNWNAKEISNLSAPTLLITGDSDIVQAEHTVEIFRLLGGGKPGDFVEMPKSQMAILPGTTHTALTDKTDIIVPMIERFLT